MNIVWTRDAVRSLRDIRQFIERDNSAVAEAVAGKIRDAVVNLKLFPRAGRLGIVDGTRELIITGLPYIVIYRILDSAVEILWVAHTSQHRA